MGLFGPNSFVLACSVGDLSCKGLWSLPTMQASSPELGNQLQHVEYPLPMAGLYTTYDVKEKHW
jgi:hypothetical protein